MKIEELRQVQAQLLQQRQQVTQLLEGHREEQESLELRTKTLQAQTTYYAALIEGNEFELGRLEKQLALVETQLGQMAQGEQEKAPNIA